MSNIAEDLKSVLDALEEEKTRDEYAVFTTHVRGQVKIHVQSKKDGMDRHDLSTG